jgi:hypothetical protein
MQCTTCGFDNVGDARFCGECGAALAVPKPIPDAPSSVHQPVARPRHLSAKLPSRALLLTIAAILLVGGPAYWWTNKAPGRYEPDNGGLFPILIDGKHGYMDASGKTLITPQFDGAEDFSEARAAVRVGSKVGYIDDEGTIVITPQFEWGGPFRYGRAQVTMCCSEPGKNSARSGFIDTDGRIIGSPTFGFTTPFSDGLAAAQFADGATGFINRDGKLVIIGVLSFSGFSDGVAPALRHPGGETTGFIDTQGKWVIEPQFEAAEGFANGLAPVKVGGRWGYISHNGKFVINPQFEEAGEFYDGWALVGDGGKRWFVNTEGTQLGTAKFDGGREFRSGRAAVKISDHWGFVDESGTIVIQPQFAAAGSFQNGLAHVLVAGKWAYITTSGEFVVDPFPGRIGIPKSPVREVWHLRPPTEARSGSTAQLLLRRDGATVTGFYWSNAAEPRLLAPIKGEARSDGTLTFADDTGLSWNGTFRSSVLIDGTQTASGQDSTVRLYLARDATSEEVTTAENQVAAAAALRIERTRVEAALAGKWFGLFSEVPNAQLSITRQDGSYTAVLLYGPWREALRVEIRADNAIVLVGTSVESVDGSSTSSFNLDTLEIRLSDDGTRLTGQFRDGRTTGPVSMTRNPN